MRKKIMILGASILQLPAINKAKELGYEIIAVDMNPEAIGFKEEGVICEVVSTIDSEKVLEIAQKHRIDGIMTLASDMPMRTVAFVAKHMGLIGIDEKTALRATNKAEMRSALKSQNVPVPMFFYVSSKSEFYVAVKKIEESGYKCIVKPVDNSGSRGIILLENFDKVTLDQAYEYCKKHSRCGGLMVEEYMEGPEVSVETLNIDGICHVIQITDKITTGAPYFVEMGHSQPSQMPDDIKEEIRRVAIAANKAIGIENGPSHTEIKVTKDGPKIVELGARLGGDNITSHLVPLSTGVDMVECCLKIALNEQPNHEPKYDKASAIKYFNTNVGVIKSITGLEYAKEVEGIKEISFVHSEGEYTNGIYSSSDRIGFIISQGNNVSEAVAACEKAMNNINIIVE